MGSSDVKINLLFNADTSAAQRNMQQLSQLLHNISNKTAIGVESGSLNQAIQSARQLQVHLQEAMNVDTGKLDLSKLNSSLKKSKTDLVTLTNNLKAIGPEGEQAFIKVANAVASAETPMVKLNGRLKDFAQTMANTVKWQIASNAVHGLQSILEGAVGHAKDLNRALNDIRIVTGYSEVGMEKFAKSASESAKALSTTTTEYAKAALIFYQQGLTGDEVTERADTVIKLSQVTGQSAQQVSDQMTAIWNNFDDGSQSLEYYADVLAKLGAATAADTQEITDGLSKFAAVADTVGLSYETAAASVATVVDKTKQSADVVGTAFKSIFARMQGLSLGETLEDGVDLNKYSEALSKVGVNVLDAKGEMRDMDDILNELGEKWEGFGETTQIAIAQTVGGIRQYNQMMALMNNWDSVKDNIDLAAEATGTLSEQQEIWADSYEAAANRVKEAQNQLYESFINDKALIGLNNVTADIIHAFTALMDRMGGVIPVVLTLAGAFSKTLFPLAIMGFKKLGNAVSVWTGKATKDIVSMQTTMMSSMQDTLNNSNLTEGVRQQIEVSQKLLAVKRQVAIVSQSMTAIQKEEMASNLALYESRAMEVQKLLERKAALEEEIKLERQKINESSSYKTRSSVGSKKVVEDFTSQSKEKGYSNDYVEEITTEAVSTSRTDTTAKIKALQDRKVQMQSDRDAQVQELDNQRQIASSHQAVLEQKEAANPVNGIMTESGQEHFNKWDEAQQKVQELEQSLQDTEASYKAQQEALDIQIEKLTTIKELQDQIHDIASEEKMSDISAGSVTKGDKDLFSPGSSDLTTISMETNMGASAIEKMGGSSTINEAGELADFSVDSSVESLTKLYQTMGQYKTQLNEINTMEADFNNTSMIDLYSQLSDTYDKTKYSATEFAAAQEALSAAEEEVASTTKQVQNAEAKLATVLKKGGKNTKEIKKAQTEVAKAHTKAAQASAKYAQTLSKQPKIFKDVVKAQKPILQSKDRFLEMARSAGVSEKEIKKLSNSFDSFKKTGDPKHLTGISTALGQLKTATGNTIGNLESLSGEIREMMIAAGMSDEQIAPIINKLRELSGVAPQAAGAMEDFNNETNKIGNGIQITASGLAKGAETLATFAAQASMAYAAGQSLASIFDSSATPMERFGSVLTTLTTLLPVVTFALKGLSNAKRENTKESIKQTVASAKEAIAHGANTVATWAQTAAEVALKIAQNPAVGAVVLGLVLAAGVAMAVYTKNTEAATEAVENQNKADQENAEAIKESANAWREQSALMDDVIVKHHQLQQAGKDTSDVLKDLATTAKDLGNAYRDMAEDLGLDLGTTKVTIDGKEMTLEDAIRYMEQAGKEGDVDTAETYQEGIDSFMNASGKETADQGAKAAMTDVAMDMDKDGGAKYKDDKVTRKVGGIDWGADTYDADSIDILAKHLGSGGKVDDNTYNVALDASDSGAFLKDYEALMAAAEEMKADLGENVDKSDTYREVMEMLDASKESYETLKAAQQEADKYNVFDAEKTLQGQTFSEEAGGETMDLKNIDSLKEYQEYRDALMAEVGSDPVAQQAAQDWLDAHSNLSEYEDAKNKIDYVVANKDNWSDKGTDLQKYYDSLSEEEKTLFLEVDFDEANTTAEIDAQIKHLQNEADKADRVKIAEELEIDADEFEAYTQMLKKQYEDNAAFADYTADEYDKAMTEVAKANKRMEKGVKKIADNWEDFNDIMTDSTATAEDISTILPEVNEGLQDVLNLSDEQFELLPPDFAKKNWGLIQDVVNGVEGAVDTLRDKAGQEILMSVDGVVDPNGNIDQGLLDVHNAIASFDSSKFEVGIAINKEDEAAFYETCQSMINAAGMTKDQAQAYFGSMGYNVEFDDNPQTVQEQVTEYKYTYDYDEKGEPIYKHVTPITKTVEMEVDAPTIKTITPNGSYGGGIGVNTTAPKTSTKGKDKGGGGGGGGSKKEPQKAEEVKKSDVVERYKQTEDALDDLRNTMNDVEKSMDRLYGASRITQIQRTNEMLQTEVKLLQQKKKEAQAYLALDRKELNSKASAAGVSFSYDENGNISNYDSQMTKLYNQLDGAIDAANRDGDASEEEQKKIDEIQKKIDELKDAISQYDETRELLEDLDDELDDKFYEWQDNNAEIINYKFEIEMELKDDELQIAEYYMDKISDDFYKRAEGIAYLNKQMAVQTSRLGDYEIYMDELKRAYAEGEISQAAYIEGLNNITDGALDNAAALQELDKQMMAYYGETLTAASEELDKFTERMEHQQSVLEHYLTIMDLMGESTNYAKVGEVLVAQGDMLKDQMETTKQEYLMYAQEADENYLAWMSAENEEEAELYKQRYEDSLALASEAQEEYLSLAESYGEKLREILDNSLSQYAQDLENALTGGTSFNQMSTRWERAASLQEEYLTNTNKIYETTKLMNQAQKQIDKSTSSVAKERLKQFINETNQLQKKGKLSQFELEIQQAKYELLLAELALEDARDAKQQVRLSRDAEGNFGYIYTANAEEVSDAEEKFLEAQNNLYNTALEGANDYAQKYQQTLNEMYDELVDLQQQYLDGAFETEEEYQNAVLETKQYYYSLLEGYSDLYTVAVSTDARVLEDAWTTEFNSMIYNTENWKVEVEKYVGQVGKAFDQWESDMDRLASDVGIGGDLENLTEKVSEVTTEHEKLTDLVNSKVLPALKSEILEVRNLTTEYAKLRKVQLEAIKGFEQVAEKAQEEKKKEVKDEKPKNVAPSAAPPKKPSKPKSPQGDGKLNVGDVVTFTGQYYNDSYGTKPTGDVFSGQKDAVKITKIVDNPKTKNGQNYYIHIGNAKSGQGYTQLGWVKKDQLTGYDTGGYTGKWGSYGKLAMLHEKELVLNKKDTQNLLETITLMRDINKMIDMQAAMMQMDNIMKSPGYSAKKHMLQQEALEQKVSIEANFPNVASHFEIEEAFMNLVNQASQYANRK